MVIGNLLKGKIDIETRKELLKYWFEKLFQDRLTEFIISSCWELPDEYIPKSVIVSNMAKEIGQRFLQRKNTAEVCCTKPH